MPDAHPAFATLSLTSEYLAAERGGRTIFSGVSFALKGGDALAIKGPNGAGKSTLLRVVAGLIRPSAGAVSIAPRQSEGLGGRVHYAGHLDALKGVLTVAQNLSFWAKLWGADPTMTEAALDTVGIGQLAALPAAVLSAGQRRRAALARLLLAPRPLWLLDEPTASLDASGEALLGQFLSAHLARGGIALIATHADLPIAPTHVLTLGAAA